MPDPLATSKPAPRAAPATTTLAERIARSEELSREPHSGTPARHRRLFQLRPREPALLHGRLGRVQTPLDESARWLALERERGKTTGWLLIMRGRAFQPMVTRSLHSARAAG